VNRPGSLAVIQKCKWSLPMSENDVNQRLIRLSLFGLAWTPESAARFAAGVLAILENLHAINKYVLHANRVLMWFLKGRAIGNRCRIDIAQARHHDLP